MTKKILIVKTTSMGDVIHALPAICDIRRALPDAQIDWVVEGSFADIPALSASVENVHTVAVRRWRKSLFSAGTREQVKFVKQSLRQGDYDLVIDLQGLLKSAWIARWAGAPVAGYDKHSIKEPAASFFYQRKFSVSKSWSAIERCRSLCAQALGYDYPKDVVDFGLKFDKQVQSELPYVVFLVNTSRDTKLWNEAKWIELGRRLVAEGKQVHLLWASPQEHERVLRLQKGIGDAIVYPRLSIAACAEVIAGAQFAVGVDTGLTHLAAATARPTVGLFLDYPIELVGLTGEKVKSLGGVGADPSVGEVYEAIKEVLA